MKTELELRHLRVFAAVVDAGTHAGAGRALGLSQSTISETLSALERAVGVELFRKMGKGASALTEAGDVLLDYSRRMFALSHELTGALAAASTRVKATLTVSAVESIGAYVLPQRLAALRDRWPAVRVDVTTGSCDEIRARVAAGECDLGLVLEPESGPGAGAGVLLARPRLLILAASAHPLARAAAAVDQLSRCEFYMCDAGGNYHQALRHLFDTAGVPAPRTQAMGTIEGVKRGILAGGTALGLLPQHAVEAEMRDGLLAEVRVQPALPSVMLRAVTAPGAPRSPVVDELVESLREATPSTPRRSPEAARPGGVRAQATTRTRAATARR